MRNLIEIRVWEKSILYTGILLGIFLAVILLMNHKQEKRYLPYLIIDGFCALISYLEFNLLVIAMTYVQDGRNIYGWRRGLVNKPWTLYIAVQLVMIGIEVLLWMNDHRWRKTHLSSNSIKESMDSMPYGICCYYEDGMPRLINKEMQRISQELFGEQISNAATFWKQICTENVTERGIRITDYSSPTWVIDEKKVLSFLREKINYRNGFLYEILARDITEEYEKNRKLSIQNERMRIVTDKLKEYSKNVNRLTMEKEVLDAKVRMHSELGQILVVSRRYLAVSDIDERQLLDMWNKNIKLLKREGSNISQNDYELLYVNAKQLGVSLTMPDILPEDEEIKEVILAAGNECITNTYKYAREKDLIIEIEQDEEHYILRIQNEGDHPMEEIQEKGGLRNLRNMIESKGGTMIITGKPYFCLTIVLEKR